MSTPAPLYSLAYTADAKNDIASVDGSLKKRLKKVLENKLAVDPEGYGTQLRGPLAGYWKHEFASHRIVYLIRHELKLVVVCAVGSRRGTHATDIYQQLTKTAELGKTAEQIRAVVARIASPKKEEKPDKK